VGGIEINDASFQTKFIDAPGFRLSKLRRAVFYCHRPYGNQHCPFRVVNALPFLALDLFYQRAVGHCLSVGHRRRFRDRDFVGSFMFVALYDVAHTKCVKINIPLERVDSRRYK
jgi:hypothetical protein